jgi:spermidine synthase
MKETGDEICFKKSRYIIYQPYRGLHLAYHARRLLFSGQSKFQKIDIIDNDAYGRMLLLDNNVQHTEYDSWIFNEALCGHARRSGLTRILILGGGSGQTVMSLLGSNRIQQVTVVEIDKLVVETCKRYIRGVGEAFDDPRVRVVIGDAFKFVRLTGEQFDGAIIDLTEFPFRTKSSAQQLGGLYEGIKTKCQGRCSQYIGSSVGLSYGPKLRKLAENLSRGIFTRATFEEVFIPSFGAPHVFMHAGYG